MAKDPTKSPFMMVLDYILNDAGMREIDALEAAVERRRRDLTARTGIISLDPARAAREMSGTIQSSVNASMDSIRNTFRQFACDLIRKEAPELSDDQMDELIEAWIPETAGRPPQSSSMPSDSPVSYHGLAQKGLINGVPPDAMGEMITQFVAYSTGTMPLTAEAALRDAVGDWTTVYWKKFPREIQTVVRKYLNGRLEAEEFEAVLEVLLR